MATKKETRAQIIGRITSLGVEELASVFAGHYNGSPLAGTQPQNVRVAEVAAKRLIGAGRLDLVPQAFIDSVKWDREKGRTWVARFDRWCAKALPASAAKAPTWTLAAFYPSRQIAAPFAAIVSVEEVIVEDAEVEQAKAS
jgi:hypothetical protein